MRRRLYVCPALVFLLLSRAVLADAQDVDADAGTSAPAPAARVTLAACVRLALTEHPSLRGAEAVRDEARAERRVARGRFGPVVRVEANVVRWDSSFDLPLPLNLPGLDVPPIPVRDATTTQVSATVIQPLSGLWMAYEGHRVQQLGEVAARHQYRTIALDVVVAVVDAYLQALEAERLSELARVQAQTIEAHVERARRMEAQELIAPNDLLAAEVRLADARAQLAQALGGARLARVHLAFQIGLPSDEEVWPADIEPPDTETQASPARHESELEQQRPELGTARARVEQAHAGVRVATAQMLPQVSAVGGMQRVGGVHFQPRTAWFVGLQLTWSVWEGGSSYYSIDAARARATQAAAGLTQLQEGLRLEIAQAEIAYETARAQLDVVRTAVVLAERNLMTVERQFEQQASTSTDVLDAAALLHVARVREAQSQYGVLRAQARLRRAIGAEPISAAETAP